MLSGESEIGVGAKADQLERLVWSPAADPALVDAASASRPRRFARRLQRFGLPRPVRLPPGVGHPAMQALRLLPADATAAVAVLTRETLLAAVRDASRKQLGNHVVALLDAADADETCPPTWLAAWLTLLPTARTSLAPDVLLRFWRRTLSEVQRWLRDNAPAEADPVGADAELRDEIAFRAGIVFRPLAAARDWEESARGSWRQRLSAARDEPAWPRLPAAALQDWLAALVRTTTDAATYETPLWRKRDQATLRRLFRSLTAALLNNGTLAGDRGECEPVTSLLQSLGRLTGLEKSDPELQLIRAVAAGRKRRRPSGQCRNLRWPGFQSDVSQSALLRTHWGTQATIVHLDYSSHSVRVDASIGGERCLQGQWSQSVRIDGESVQADKPWECECWFSDADADFVELSQDLGGGASLLRQVFLGRTDDLLVVAEAVRGVAADAPVELRSVLPVATGVMMERDGLTRELQFQLGSRRVRTFPVHLPWARAAFSAGDCRPTNDGLHWQIAGCGPQCQVLMLSWSRATADAPADGGPLTVAEDLRKVSAREACAGRLRIGSRQWVYLHNLTAGLVPRSVLGCHTPSETVIGRVGDSGKIEYLVHVEGRSAAIESAENSPESTESACRTAGA